MKYLRKTRRKHKNIKGAGARIAQSRRTTEAVHFQTRGLGGTPAPPPGTLAAHLKKQNEAEGSILNKFMGIRPSQLNNIGNDNQAPNNLSLHPSQRGIDSPPAPFTFFKHLAEQSQNSRNRFDNQWNITPTIDTTANSSNILEKIYKERMNDQDRRDVLDNIRTVLTARDDIMRHHRNIETPATYAEAVSALNRELHNNSTDFNNVVADAKRQLGYSQATRPNLTIMQRALSIIKDQKQGGHQHALNQITDAQEQLLNWQREYESQERRTTELRLAQLERDKATRQHAAWLESGNEGLWADEVNKDEEEAKKAKLARIIDQSRKAEQQTLYALGEKGLAGYSGGQKPRKSKRKKRHRKQRKTRRA
tara:strand:+ start:1014 stop:2108 length:1095 start_codon:yes stop_codon:yes gene_type:complete